MSSRGSNGFGDRSRGGRGFGSSGGGFGSDRGRFGDSRGSFGDRNRGFGDRGGGMKSKSNPGEHLRRVKWDQYSLVPFAKHFYNPHPNVLNVDPRVVEKFRDV